MLHLARRAALALAFIALCGGHAAAQPSLSPDDISRIDASVLKMLDATHAPGAAIAVEKDGVLVYTKAYGTTDAAGRTDITTQTQFEIGSITKQFTAAAIMQLAEAGKLKLSDKLAKYVPEYTAGKNVTIRQLLNQISGIPDYTEVPSFLQAATTQPGSVAAILKLVQGKPLNFRPGTEWQYSNTNYILLGRIVERASGQTYDAYLRKHVLDAAGMSNTVTIADEGALKDFPTGYNRHKGQFIAAPRFGAKWAWSAGYLVSTVGDLIKWDDAFFGGKIVPMRDVALMTSPGHLRSGAATNYGFGWLLDKENGHKRVWHNGGTFGFAAANMLYPDEHLTIVVLLNDAEAPPSQAVAARIFEALHPQEVAAAAKGVPGEDLAVTARAKDWIHRMVTGAAIDRTQLTKEMSDALTPQLLASAKAQMAPLGDPASFTFKGVEPDGHGNKNYLYRVVFPAATLTLYFGLQPDGKISTILFKA